MAVWQAMAPDELSYHLAVVAEGRGQLGSGRRKIRDAVIVRAIERLVVRAIEEAVFRRHVVDLARIVHDRERGDDGAKGEERVTREALHAQEARWHSSALQIPHSLHDPLHR